MVSTTGTPAARRSLIHLTAFENLGSKTGLRMAGGSLVGSLVSELHQVFQLRDYAGVAAQAAQSAQQGGHALLTTALDFLEKGASALQALSISDVLL